MDKRMFNNLMQRAKNAGKNIGQKAITNIKKVITPTFKHIKCKPENYKPCCPANMRIKSPYKKKHPGESWHDFRVRRKVSNARRRAREKGLEVIIPKVIELNTKFEYRPMKKAA